MTTFSKTTLLSGDTLQILAMLKGMPLNGERHAAMRVLKDHSEVNYNQVLAWLYDLSVHRTGDVYEEAPEHELNRYFVGHLAEDFEDAPSLPSTRHEHEAYRLAVHFFNLESLFERECAAGHALPRKCFQAPIPSFEQQIEYVVRETRKFEPMTATELALKGSEEHGEFATAILVETGAIRHKTLKEPSFGETADTFLCHLSALAKVHPHMSPAEIAAEVARWLYIKQLKYDQLLQNREREFTN